MCFGKNVLFNLEGTGKNVPEQQRIPYGGLAQLGERLPCKQEVTGSIPVLSTKRLTETIKKLIVSLSFLKESSRCTLKTEH